MTEQPPTNKQKLSTLMRKGIVLRPLQITEDYYADGGSCALGAVYEGLTGQRPYSAEANEPTQEMFRAIEQATGMTFSTRIEDKEGRDYSLFNYIVMMNDEEHFSREQIADWLESIDL